MLTEKDGILQTDPSNLIPFIFARATEESQKLYENGKGDLKVRDWIMVIAYPDFKVYDSRWMDDSEQGKFCLIPDVDISFEKDHVFPTFKEARKAVGLWWVQRMEAEMLQAVEQQQIPEKVFTIYWKHGKRSVIKGHSIDAAFAAVGYGAGATAAIDWYDNGDTNTHEWVPAIKTWQRIAQVDFNSYRHQT